MAKIRKIKEKELVGGTSNTEVYPITHARAVYDKNNTPLSDTLEFLNTEIVWNNSSTLSNMNDFVVAGVYDIKGEHTRMDDNLPILNTGGGHSFNTRLTVLDSSIPGNGKNDDKCITQVLSFSNRLGQGEVYIRTGKGSSLDSLTWEKWSTLQRNVNVDEVGSLDDLKDNGIYSGVWLKGHYNSYPLTFVCVVINDYFIGVAPRRISQFVYGLSKFDGSVVYQSRVWDDSKGRWGDWEILNKNEITSMISAEIKKVTDGIDPEKIDSIKDIVAWIEAHGGDVTAIYNAIQQNTVKINAEISRAKDAEQTLSDTITKNVENIVNYIAEEVETLVKADDNIKSSALGYDRQTPLYNADKVTIKNTTLDGKKEHSFDIPAATTENAGVMSAEDKRNLDAVVNNVESLAVKKFYTLPAPVVKENKHKKIEKVSLNILGQEDEFSRLQALTLDGTIERVFKANKYNIKAGIPVHFVSYVYSIVEQRCRHQLYSADSGYLVNKIVNLQIGWNKLEIEYTFESVPQNELYYYLGKVAGNDFYLYKTFVYNGIVKANLITEQTNDELNNRLVEVENVADRVQGDIFDNIIYDNEDIIYKGNGKTYDYKTRSIPVVSGDVFFIKLGGVTKPESDTYDSHFRLLFYNANNEKVIADKFFYASNTPLNTEITIPDGCVKLDYQFGLSSSLPSVLDGEYKWSGLTLIQKSRLTERIEDIEGRVESLENLSNDWTGKILSTYGDSVTALQGGDFDIPYNETSYRWGNRVANYLKMSKHYGRGIGGQKYAWGTNGGAVTWVYKDTGKMYNRNDSFNLDNWDGSSFPATWTDAQKNTVLNGIADGSMLSVRGCMCSWLRITSMYPAAIKDTIDAVFVMCHNDGVDGKEFSWVEGDTTDPEWATSEQYATYGGDYNIGTLEGGIASTIMKLQAWMPNAVIILGTPINGQGTTGQLRPDAGGLYKQVQHVKNVGLRFSIPVIDVYATCGINGLNRTDYITDNIHPYSVEGSKMIARAIIGGMKGILPKL